MKPPKNRLVALSLAVLALLAMGAALPRVARAAWPMARHDPGRVGTADGTSNITAPIAYWRTYLGGSIGGTQFMTADANGDGVPDAILATGGTVTAVAVPNSTIWSSGTLAIQAFAGIGDLDGDGKLDIVAYSGNAVIVLSLPTGAVEWTEPAGEMGTIGVVRVGDITGDGKPDVTVLECGCCGANSGNTGFFWTFGNGFAKARRLGSVPEAVFTCGTSISTTLIKADPSSKGYETLLANGSNFAILSAQGSILAQSSAVGFDTAESNCATGNLDGKAGDEAVCLLNSGDPPAINERRVTVLHYSKARGALDVLWSKVVAPDTGGDLSWVDPLEDLDGDGTFEIVFATYDPTNGWQTHVLDALTGDELVTPVGGQYVSGTAAMETPGQRILMTTDGTNVTGWLFERSPSPTLTKRWVQPSVALLTYPDMSLVSLQSIYVSVTATDLDGTGLDDAVMQSITTGSLTTMVGISGAGGQATQVASHTLPQGTDLLDAWIVPPISTTTPQVAIARSDGAINLLDGSLAPTSAGAPLTEIDVRFGGYYASGGWGEMYKAPRVFSLDGASAQSVVVDDSRDALLRIDAATASLAIPPTVVWQATHTHGPAVVPGLDGAEPGIACLALAEPVTNPPRYRARALRSADGSVLWDQPVTGGSPLQDLVPANLDGDSILDFALQLTDFTGVNLVTAGYSGKDGSLLWETPPFYPGVGGVESAGISTADWNGDGIDDVVLQGGKTYVLSGVDGSQLASGGPIVGYALPLLADTTASGQDEAVFGGGFSPVSMYSHDLQTALWTSTDADRPYPYAALVQCAGPPSIPVLVEGSWQNPARLKMTPMSGTTLGNFTTIVLAGGQLYPNEAAALAAGAFLGQLTSASAHSDLTGLGRPTAVVGSSDGWLYGVDPCGSTLDFSVSFGAAVGEAVFGDTDGDGRDEILVTAADGYLYDLKNEAIAAPAYVWDTDPPAVTNHDVSTIVTQSELSATWGGVTGATSYEVEVVTTAGTALSTPLWQNVGAVTSASLTGLSLRNDTEYFFAVRAVGDKGVSVDAISNGVTVFFPDGGVVDSGQDGAGSTDASVDGAADAIADSGLGPDATTPLADGGRDAGVDARLDARFEDGSQAVAEVEGGGGCGCRVAAAPAGEASRAGLAAATLLGWLARRRRSRRRAG